MASRAPTSIAVQDPLPLVRLGFQRLLLQSGRSTDLVGLTAEPEGLVQICTYLEPDVAVFELLPTSHHLVDACRRAHPGIRLVGLHLGRRRDHAEQGQQLDVRLLSYAAPVETVVSVLIDAGAEERELVDVERRRSKRTLTPLEREVLRLAGEGLTCAEAALRLHLPAPTVRTMTDRALTLLGAETVPAAVRRAREAGLVPRLRAS